jgi:hypothetical protein
MGGFRFNGICTATDIVGDLIRIKADSYVVERANPTTYGTMPAIGVIINKPTLTTCIVQTFGHVIGVYSGLNPGKIYFVGDDGRPTTSTTVPGVGTTRMHQSIGAALTTDILFLSPNFGLTKMVR